MSEAQGSGGESSQAIAKVTRTREGLVTFRGDAKISDDAGDGLLTAQLGDALARTPGLDPGVRADIGHALDKLRAGVISAKERRLALAITMMALGVPGECQLAEPYKPMRVVRSAPGVLELCCAHNPEHCEPLSV